MNHTKTTQLEEVRIPVSWDELSSFQPGQVVRIRNLSTYNVSDRVLTAVKNDEIELATKLNLGRTGGVKVISYKCYRENLRFNNDELGIRVLYEHIRWIDADHSSYHRLSLLVRKVRKAGL